MFYSSWPGGSDAQLCQAPCRGSSLRESLQSSGLHPAETPDYPKACWMFFPPPFHPEKVRPSHVSLAGCVDTFRNNLCTKVVTVTVLGLFPWFIRTNWLLRASYVSLSPYLSKIQLLWSRSSHPSELVSSLWCQEDCPGAWNMLESSKPELEYLPWFILIKQTHLASIPPPFFSQGQSRR